MTLPPRFGLSDAEKDALLVEQAEMIQRLADRITELEALVGKPRTTSSNSHLPPSKDGPGRAKRPKRPAKKRPPRAGRFRPLTETLDKTERRMASACGHCGADVSGAQQRCRHRYDHIDLPPIRPMVTRVEIFGGRCGGCGHRYRAQAPVGMPPGTPFGPGIRSLLMYLHHSHHVGFERLSRMLRELFGLTISEGAIAKAFQRMGADLDAARKAIQDKLLTARIIASDETTTRVGRATHWQWVFLSDKAVLHKIAPSRARSVADEVLGGHKAWRTKFFVFMTDRDVPATNNVSEREIRPSVVFRKVTNGFRSDWGAQIHAGYRSATGTARLSGQPALDAIRDLIGETFAVA